MKPELLTSKVTHRHGGNGWVVVQSLADDYCRVASFFKDKDDKPCVGNRAYLAHCSLLKPEPPVVMSDGSKRSSILSPDDLVPVDQLRSDIKSGRKYVEGTRILEIEPNGDKPTKRKNLCPTKP